MRSEAPQRHSHTTYPRNASTAKSNGQGVKHSSVLLKHLTLVPAVMAAKRYVCVNHLGAVERHRKKAWRRLHLSGSQDSLELDSWTFHFLNRMLGQIIYPL